MDVDIGTFKEGSELCTSRLAKKFCAFRQAFSNYKAYELRKSIASDICIKTIYVPLTIPANVAPYIGTHVKTVAHQEFFDSKRSSGVI